MQTTPGPMHKLNVYYELSIHEQSRILAQLQYENDDAQITFRKLKNSKKKQKNAVKQNAIKFEWIQEQALLCIKHHKLHASIDSLFLQCYNKAIEIASNAFRPSSIENPCPNRYNETYQKELELLLQEKQTLHSTFLNLVQSSREEHLAIKKLMHALKSKAAEAESKTAIDCAISCLQKEQCQEIVLEAIAGHEMVEIDLNEMIKQAEAEYSASCAGILSSCFASCRAYNSQDILETKDVVCGLIHNSFLGQSHGASLEREMEGLFTQLYSDFEAVSQTLKQEFLQKASQDNAAGSVENAALSAGGWEPEEEQRFLHVLKAHDQKSTTTNPENLHAAFAIVLSNKSKKEIQAHLQFHALRRFYLDKLRDRQCQLKRQLESAKALASQKMENLCKLIESESEKKNALASRDKLNKIHARLHQWREKKQARTQVMQQQEEIQKLRDQHKEDNQMENQWNERLIHKQRLQTFQYERAMRLKAELEVKQQLELQLLHEKEHKSVENSQRVHYRSKTYQRKVEEKKIQSLQELKRKSRRVVRMEALKMKTPYAAVIADMKADPNRAIKATAAFTASIKGEKDTELFPVYGYDCDTLFRNARFKLGIALREAGLHNSQYARTALEKVKSIHARSYQTSTSSTQLW